MHDGTLQTQNHLEKRERSTLGWRALGHARIVDRDPALRPDLLTVMVKVKFPSWCFLTNGVSTHSDLHVYIHLGIIAN